MAELLHELILASACRTPAAAAPRYCGEEFLCAGLAQRMQQAAGGLLALGLRAQARGAVWLDKRPGVAA